MHLEFGFVAICLSEEKCSPAGSVTYKSVASLDQSAQRHRILQVARRNLTNTLRIMWFMQAHDIRLYRISANLIPLATHQVTDGWAWWDEEELKDLGRKIGAASKREGYRLSSHLPELCGFTSEPLFHWAREYLAYHERLFNLLDLDESTRIVMHLGGSGSDKAEALSKAEKRLRQIADWDWAKDKVVLENDDRSFTVADLIPLAETVGLPVVFDWHHHWCNGRGSIKEDRLPHYLHRAFALWGDRPPKVHISSPRSEKSVRAHADYVDPAFVRPFFALLTDMGLPAVDVMIEAKQKDLALLKLREELLTAPL